MKLGMVGLGRMGGNMAERLRTHGHEVVGYDVFSDATDVGTLEDLVRELPAPRLIWVMVPAGDPTEDTVASLTSLLGEGDVVVDGGNSNWRDSVRRAESLGAAGIGFIDAGTSGGVWGLAEGYCLMVGGATEHVTFAQPVFDALAPEGGFVHTGAAGTGHFTKMVHNGIEYGLMQAYAEGYELLARSGLDIDARGALERVAAGERRALLAARPPRARARPAPRARGPRTRRAGLGGGPLDRPGGDRARGRHAGDQRGALRPVREPGPGGRRDEGDRRAAGAVRRARGAA